MVSALVAAGIASLVLLHPARESSVPSAWVERYAPRFWIAVLPRLAQHGVTEPCNALTALLSGGSACLGRGVRHDLSQRGVGLIVIQQQGVDQREAVETRVSAVPAAKADSSAVTASSKLSVAVNTGGIPQFPAASELRARRKGSRKHSPSVNRKLVPSGRTRKTIPSRIHHNAAQGTGAWQIRNVRLSPAFRSPRTEVECAERSTPFAHRPRGLELPGRAVIMSLKPFSAPLTCASCTVTSSAK